MRVIAGLAKGRRLRTLKGRQVRPTLARIREVLFDILAPRIVGSRFLDLFAGSGSVGIEALSRGAQQSVFVESEKRAARALVRNLEGIGLQEQAKVICEQVGRALPRLAIAGQAFDIIFMDPPYCDSQVAQNVLKWLNENRRVLAPEGDLVVQESAKADQIELSSGLKSYRTRKIGDSKLTFWRMTEED